MAKKKITRKAAQSFAKRTGAQVDMPPAGPKPIKKQATERPLPSPPPQQAPAPVIDQGPVIAAIEGASEQMKTVITDLMNQVSQLKLQVDHPTQWIFDFERDSFGRIKRIKASVPDIKKLLN